MNALFFGRKMSHIIQMNENRQNSNGIVGSSQESGIVNGMPQISAENKDLSHLKRPHLNRSDSQSAEPPSDGESYTKKAREIFAIDMLEDASTADQSM